MKHKLYGVGEIKKVDNAMGFPPYAVEFINESDDLLNCRGYCEDKHGLWCTDVMLEPVEEKGPAETIGATIDEAIKESPIIMQQYTQLKKQYDELQSKYDDLQFKYDELMKDYKYEDGYIDGMQYIIDGLLKEEN